MRYVSDPVAWLVPVFLLLAIIEMTAGRRATRGKRFDTPDLLASAILGIGCAVSNLLFAGFAGILAFLAFSLRPWTIEPSWWSWLLALLLVDIAYYFGHRIAHGLRFFWATHSVHHSSRYFNLMVGFRNGWTGFLYPTALLKLLILVVGFPLEMVVIATAANIAHQFVLHTEAVPRLPAIVEAVFNTPAHHRIHHASNPEYVDRNFGGILIVWDRLFGTFAAERPEDPPRFGLSDGRRGDRIGPILLIEWRAILSDLRQARSPRALARALFARP